MLSIDLTGKRAFVAGVAADILARQPKLSPAQVKLLIEETAKSRERWTREDGWGIVQPAAALRQAARPWSSVRESRSGRQVPVHSTRNGRAVRIVRSNGS